MKKQIGLLASAALLCVGIWTFVFLTLFQANPSSLNADTKSHQETVQANNDLLNETEENDRSSQESSHEKTITSLYEKEKSETLTVNVDLTVDNIHKRGIHPGDFEDIAHGKIISIDMLENALANKMQDDDQ